MKYIILSFLIISTFSSCTKKNESLDIPSDGYKSQTYITKSYRSNTDTMTVSLVNRISGNVHLNWIADADKFQTQLWITTNKGKQIVMYVSYIRSKEDIPIHKVCDSVQCLTTYISGFHYQDGSFQVEIDNGDYIKNIDINNIGELVVPTMITMTDKITYIN